MTESAQLALIGILMPIVTTIGIIIVNVVNAQAAARKLDHITVLTNSTLTAANERIEKLEAIINELIADRDKKVIISEQSSTAGKTAAAILESVPSAARKTGELPQV